MEIKLFGRSLFSAKKNTVDMLFDQAVGDANSINGGTKAEFLPDFQEFNGGGRSETPTTFSEYVFMESPADPAGAVAAPGGKAGKKGKKRATQPKGSDRVRIRITPKGVYEMRLLHDDSFRLNVNPEYIAKQLEDFKEKLALLKGEDYDMRRGVNEIASILLRMENRKKYAGFKEYFEQYPYTMGSRIATLVKEQDHLQLGQIGQFVAELPKEASTAMREYSEKCVELCGKKGIYYIIADKKDFKRSEKRRDPILLAQSPFGHFWQILGAWDDEMMFLEEL